MSLKNPKRFRKKINNVFVFAISPNVSEYAKFLPASLLYFKRRKGQKFGRGLSGKTEPHTLYYRMYCSYFGYCQNREAVKQIFLGSGKADFTPSRVEEAIFYIWLINLMADSWPARPALTKPAS